MHGAACLYCTWNKAHRLGCVRWLIHRQWWPPRHQQLLQRSTGSPTTFTSSLQVVTRFRRMSLARSVGSWSPCCFGMGPTNAGLSANVQSMQAVAVGSALGRFLPVSHHRCLSACWRAGWLRGPRMTAQRSTWLPVIINQTLATFFSLVGSLFCKALRYYESMLCLCCSCSVGANALSHSVLI